ncbi:MAG TPA: radical SAM protein [Bacteroidales bacterium]|nr:radical SAM protein [Bacteroidales bacterium]
MSTFLFDTIIFGPVWSRRLGESLGINLLPAGLKVCNFNCVYCECGLTPLADKSHSFPSADEVRISLENKLAEMKLQGEYLDCITFAGNGEPTLHPEFPRIIKETIEIRNRLLPGAKIAVLSNATLIGQPHIHKSLLEVDLNILKLDSAIPRTLEAINCPKGSYNPDNIKAAFRAFSGKLLIQSLFFKGTCNGIYVDNTTENEIKAWLAVLEEVKPQTVMIYSLARDTAVNGLQAATPEELEHIASLVRNLGIETLVTP